MPSFAIDSSAATVSAVTLEEAGQYIELLDSGVSLATACSGDRRSIGTTMGRIKEHFRFTSSEENN